MSQIVDQHMFALKKLDCNPFALEILEQFWSCTCLNLQELLELNVSLQTFCVHFPRAKSFGKNLSPLSKYFDR